MKVLKFSAIWCPSCLIMNNVINKIKEEYKLEIINYDYDMDEEEFDNVEKYVSQYVEWFEHPDYWQRVPKVIATGELILDE